MREKKIMRNEKNYGSNGLNNGFAKRLICPSHEILFTNDSIV